MKNTIYAIVIVVCLLVAVVVFVKTRSGGGSGIDSISDTEQVWVKCKACNASYEMSRKQFNTERSEKMKAAGGAAMLMTPPLTCQKCGKNMVFPAEKCPTCNEIFIKGTFPNDFEDRCPKCKHSKTEDIRKARLAGQGQQ